MKALDSVVIKFGRFLSQHRKNRIIKTIGNLSKTLWMSYENYNYDFNSNGEKKVLECLDDLKPKVVFDVGANNGDWINLVKRIHPNVKIYAFEPIPKLYTNLKKKFNNHKNIEIYNLGMDNESTSNYIHFDINRTGISSFYKNDFRNDKVENVLCSFETLERFTKENDIESIDFLKIDTEGMDYRVLQGAKKILKKGAVKVIQFEYGMLAIETKSLLKDFYELLEPMGYVVGKIYPNYVDFRPYHRTQEDLIGPNFIAVSKNYSSYISRLS